MTGTSGRSAGIRRWDGVKRTSTMWDGLRKDLELWFPEGDCLIYLYGRGQSRRGPSFRIPFSALAHTRCLPLLERHNAESMSHPTTWSMPGSVCSSMDTSEPASLELHIPAPADASREESFLFHLGTRNFFAWLFGKPLVGSHLGTALVDLLDRMNMYRSETEDNMKDLTQYLDEEGYTDFRECPDHALSLLYFAEHYQLKNLWTDAFVHCVGMSQRLWLSEEFEPISRVSKALINRSHLEMDVRMERAGRSLSSFLEDELSGTYLGLNSAALSHLERFRSFLHSFYVNRYGYWPPTKTGSKGSSLSKSTYRSMYFEFRNLYAYLVDGNSGPSKPSSLKPFSGSGINLEHCVAVFSKKLKYASLPCSMPLLPDISFEAPGFMDPFDLRGTFCKQTKANRRFAALAALSSATNSLDMTVMECPLVRAYARFENDCTLKQEEKVSCADGRKVRWLLIYAILQTLISVTRAPKEVKDTEGVSYPLCCQTAGTPPWKIYNTGSSSPKKYISSHNNMRPDHHVMEVDYFNHRPVHSVYVATSEAHHKLTTAYRARDDQQQQEQRRKLRPTRSASSLRPLKRQQSHHYSSSELAPPIPPMPAMPRLQSLKPRDRASFHETIGQNYINTRSISHHGSSSSSSYSSSSPATSPGFTLALEPGFVPNASSGSNSPGAPTIFSSAGSSSSLSGGEDQLGFPSMDHLSVSGSSSVYDEDGDNNECYQDEIYGSHNAKSGFGFVSRDFEPSVDFRSTTTTLPLHRREANTSISSQKRLGFGIQLRKQVSIESFRMANDELERYLAST
ncbi:hypothetical protein L228DRAFT_59765 [Xylona heveae TC161]|uniref:DUF8004 domain-containing protein n=1 Tax=Xylona heveae (strain CBS 132557 / TC161) TaxID=1328760 RepID=A0A161TFW8_XYLHT|nr:hypothetical protein L228DRAFT_59765 [Xylona heveae TC161]KZF24987.1 hypothetical protein L228DRAFT_59765 [Xylona heveae TC161]